MNQCSKIQRRDFLRSGAAATLATTLVCSGDVSLADQKPVPEGDRPWLRKTLKIGMIRIKGSLLDKFKVAKQAGFHGVELNVPGINIEEAKAASLASGLIIDGTVGGYHWSVRHSDPKPEVRADALKRLKAGLAETAAVGGDTMLLVPGHGKDGTDEEVYRRSMDSIRQALPDCEKLGVSILIENVWNDFLYDHEGGDDQTADRLAAYIDEFDSPWVGVQFDIGNHWKYGDPADWITTLGKRIKKLDIKGYSREKQNWARITEGDIDWPSVEKALLDIGFTGWLAAEVGGGDLEHLKGVSDRLEKALHCSRSLKSVQSAG